MNSVYRLKKNSHFNYTYKKGKSLACRDLILVYCRTGSKTLKAGFSVSKKIGKSVVRNKVKRRLKEAFRKLIPRLRQDYNYVFVARPDIVKADFKALCGSMRYLLKKTGMYNPAVYDGKESPLSKGEAPFVTENAGSGEAENSSVLNQENPKNRCPKTISQ